MQAIAVEQSIWIAAPREKAWRAVTEPERLDRWYATCCGWKIPALEVGARVTFFNTDTGTDADALNATIDILDPPRQMTLRWDADPSYPALTLVTTFLLNEENGGTRVTVHESGYEALSADERQAWMEQANLGYSGSVANLKALLEGQPLPY